MKDCEHKLMMMIMKKCYHNVSKRIKETSKGAYLECLSCGKKYYSYARIHKPEAEKDEAG